MSETIVKGYKVVLPDATSKHNKYKFEVGKSYNHPGAVALCSSGFHFSQRPQDCFNYYEFDSANLVYEVEASGTIVHGDDKSVCSDIRIVRQISWEEVLQLVNQGKNNTGHSNTGYRNTGYSNTGDRNTGDWNTGYRNTGYRNTGYSNTGYWNTGDRNTGYSNTGDRNTGDWNTGDRNTGYSNTGDRNTGDWNTGDRNTGYSNTGDRNTGAFCTGEASFPLFNKPSSMTAEQFRESCAYALLCQVNTKMWIEAYAMTDEEKTAFPSYKTAGGYLRDIPFKDAFQSQWNNWTEASRTAFTTLENFDAAIFEEITGVKVD